MHFDQESALPLNGLRGNRVLTPDGVVPASFSVECGFLRDAPITPGFLDGRNLLMLPGIIDIHGDALERSLRPRPGVAMPALTALRDVDAQLLSQGITTAFHGITVSWEGGLRSVPAAQGVLDTLRDHSGLLGADHRVHLRFETRFSEGLLHALEWIDAERIHFLSLNDHWPQIAAARGDVVALAKYADRAECDILSFEHRVDAAGSGVTIAANSATLLAAASGKGVAAASHDDPDEAQRRRMSGLGCRVAEFPLSRAAAEEARALGDRIVFGAPNVLRGGSHVGAPRAEDMIRAGLCDVLASDYFYPSALIAPFELAARGVLPFVDAWKLVSRNAAAAVRLTDRGTLVAGQRADVLVIDDRLPTLPRVVACIVAGTLRFASGMPVATGEGTAAP